MRAPRQGALRGGAVGARANDLAMQALQALDADRAFEGCDQSLRCGSRIGRAQARRTLTFGSLPAALSNVQTESALAA